MFVLRQRNPCGAFTRKSATQHRTFERLRALEVGINFGFDFTNDRQAAIDFGDYEGLLFQTGNAYWQSRHLTHAQSVKPGCGRRNLLNLMPSNWREHPYQCPLRNHGITETDFYQVILMNAIWDRVIP